MQIAVLVLAAASSAVTSARDQMTSPSDGWYRVEVVVFERLGDAGSNEVVASRESRMLPLGAVAFDDDANRDSAYALDETTRGEAAARAPTNRPTQAQPPSAPVVEPTPAEHAAALLADYKLQLERRSYRFEPPTSYVLAGQAGALQRSGTYRVVFHRAWIQPTPDRDQVMPMLIQAGERIGDAWRIEGTIGVTRSRYLHLDARLWYALDTPQEMGSGSREFMELREQRRMLSGELHYLDHPKLGVLARVDPIALPEDLAAELARLNSAPATGAPPTPR